VSDPVSDVRPARKWLWVIVLILLFVLVIGWFANPLGTGTIVEPAVVPAEPVAPSTDLTPAPEGSAVPVTLPETPMTNTP